MITTTAQATATVTVSKPKFVDACATVGLGLPEYPSMPSLQRVRVKTTGPDATLSSFGHDRFVTVEMPGAADGGPDTCAVLNHAELDKLVAALTKGMTARTTAAVSVELSLCDETTLAVNGYTMPVQSYPQADYPAVPGEAPTVATVGGARFSELLARVATVASSDYNMPMFTAVHMAIGRGKLTMAATDRFRMTRVSMPAECVDAAPFSIALDAAFLRAAVKRLGPGRLVIGRDVASGWVTLRYGRMLLGIQNLKVDPLPETKVLTDSVTLTVLTDRATLLAEAQRAMTVAKLKAEQTSHRVNVIVRDDSVRITPAIAGTVEVPPIPATVTAIGSEVRTFDYQGRYMVDALRNFGSDTIALHLQEGMRPVIITESTDAVTDRDAYRHIVMPLLPPR